MPQGFVIPQTFILGIHLLFTQKRIRLLGDHMPLQALSQHSVPPSPPTTHVEGFLSQEISGFAETNAAPLLQHPD